MVQDSFFLYDKSNLIKKHHQAKYAILYGNFLLRKKTEKESINTVNPRNKLPILVNQKGNNKNFSCD